MPQESPCNAKFNTPPYLTLGFKEKFGDLANLVATLTLLKILTERVQSPDGADYLQIAEYNGKRFWIIDSESYITFLLPEEY
jgi:hypothetical protein